MCPGYETCWQRALPPCKTCLELVSQQTLPCSRGRPWQSLACWKAQPCGWRVNIHPVNWTVNTVGRRPWDGLQPRTLVPAWVLAPAAGSGDVTHTCCVLLLGREREPRGGPFPAQQLGEEPGF